MEFSKVQQDAETYVKKEKLEECLDVCLNSLIKEKPAGEVQVALCERIYKSMTASERSGLKTIWQTDYGHGQDVWNKVAQK